MGKSHTQPHNQLQISYWKNLILFMSTKLCRKISMLESQNGPLNKAPALIVIGHIISASEMPESFYIGTLSDPFYSDWLDDFIDK